MSAYRAAVVCVVCVVCALAACGGGSDSASGPAAQSSAAPASESSGGAGAAATGAAVQAKAGAPTEQSLRDSFAEQLAANKAVTNLQRTADAITFTGPGPEGGTATWQVRIDSAAIEAHPTEANAYKGTVKSSWSTGGKSYVPQGNESNLPGELIANGISQDCWAFWVHSQSRWSWE